jgi:hypothetical protein
MADKSLPLEKSEPLNEPISTSDADPAQEHVQTKTPETLTIENVIKPPIEELISISDTGPAQILNEQAQTHTPSTLPIEKIPIKEPILTSDTDPAQNLNEQAQTNTPTTLPIEKVEKPPIEESSISTSDTDSIPPQNTHSHDIDSSRKKEEENYKSKETSKAKSETKPTPPPLPPPPQNTNCILFYGVTYLGCSSVNAPKSETEINRIISTLNEQGKECIEVSMSVPQSVDEKIILFDVDANDESNFNANIIAEYKMAQVLFVVRGKKNSAESSCFAFTTCHGDTMENLIFSCHVFRCKLAEAVSKILYSFWSVFNRQSIQSQQQQQTQKTTKSANTNSGSLTAASQFSSVASSLLGSLYGFGSTASLNPTSNPNSNSLQYSASFLSKCEQAVKFVTGGQSLQDQYVFRATLEIKEQDPRSSSSSSSAPFSSVPKEKDFF